ncbi:carbohydrate ABC transporter permease [Lachnospiraceae bacterium Marseille-Q4251]|nr:carbohydrate ABC transporter permease [Lachnospiraceae bacterium Marseille-Q4251]
MRVSKGRILFQTINYVIMILLAVICLFPLLNVLAMSFSSATAVSAGKVSILPVDFTASAYTYVMKRKEFWVSLVKSIERVCIGVPLSMMITILTAYPLSKEPRQLRARSVYAWLFFFTMLVSGGLIPGYLLIQKLHLMDTIWAMVLPTTVSVYNIVLMLNFFRGIPVELEEAALMDGAGQLGVSQSLCKPPN